MPGMLYHADWTGTGQLSDAVKGPSVSCVSPTPGPATEASCLLMNTTR